MSIWIPFFLAALLGTCILYVPGMLLLRTLGLPWRDALCAAPAASIALMSVLSFAYEPLSIHADVVSLVFVPVLVLLPLLLVVSRRAERFELESHLSLDGAAIALYAVVGFIAGVYVLVKQLDGPSSYFLGWDAIRHINGVQAFAESGHFSALSSSLFELETDALHSPSVGSGSFYPSGWYIVAALLAQQFGRTSVMAVNVCNFLFSSVVYPVSMLLLMSRLFPTNRLAVRLGSCVVLAFEAFPWLFLAFGPLYPNVGSMAMLPAVAALWMDVVGSNASARPVPGMLPAACVCLGGLAFTHPNALFSLALFGAVYLAHKLLRGSDEYVVLGRGVPSVVASAIFVCVFCLLWALAFRLPFLSGVTSYVWNPYASFGQMALNIVTVAYSYGWVPSVAAQPILAILIAVGFFCCCREEDSRWLAALYLLVCSMLLIGATTENTFKHILTGFWYCDHNRIAAMCSMFGTPLAARGLAEVCRAVNRLVEGRTHISSDMAFCATAALVTVLAFLPNVTLPVAGTVKTSMGILRAQLETCQDPMYGPIHWDEREFLGEAVKIVPHGAMVANYPYDGSIAAYGAYDLHVLHRNMTSAPGSGEKVESVLVRNSLDKVASDNAVRDAAESLGIEYVIKLHIDDVGAMYPGAVECADEGNWRGILSITPDTPGFELVLSQNDLELYRVVY